MGRKEVFRRRTFLKTGPLWVEGGQSQDTEEIALTNGRPPASYFTTA